MPTEPPQQATGPRAHCEPAEATYIWGNDWQVSQGRLDLPPLQIVEQDGITQPKTSGRGRRRIGPADPEEYKKTRTPEVCTLCRIKRGRKPFGSCSVDTGKPCPSCVSMFGEDADKYCIRIGHQNLRKFLPFNKDTVQSILEHLTVYCKLNTSSNPRSSPADPTLAFKFDGSSNLSQLESFLDENYLTVYCKSNTSSNPRSSPADPILAFKFDGSSSLHEKPSHDNLDVFVKDNFIVKLNLDQNLFEQLNPQEIKPLRSLETCARYLLAISGHAQTEYRTELNFFNIILVEQISYRILQQYLIQYTNIFESLFRLSIEWMKARQKDGMQRDVAAWLMCGLYGLVEFQAAIFVPSSLRIQSGLSSKLTTPATKCLGGVRKLAACAMHGMNHNPLTPLESFAENILPIKNLAAPGVTIAHALMPRANSDNTQPPMAIAGLQGNTDPFSKPNSIRIADFYARSNIEEAPLQAYPHLRPAIMSHSNKRDEQAPTDSDITSGFHGQSVFTRSSAAKNLDTVTEDTDYSYEGSAFGQCHSPNKNYGEQNLGLYTTPTIYSASDISTRPLPRDKGYITDLATDLFDTIKSYTSDVETLSRVSKLLPDLLRAFALKVGYKAQTSMQWDVSYFVHKYRSSIKQSFEDNFPLQDKSPSDDVQLRDFIISRFFAEENHDTRDVNATLATSDKAVSVSTSTEPSEKSEGDSEPPPDSGLYRNFIVESPAYSWLVASLQREATLTRANPDLMGDIGNKILSVLPSIHKVSRRAPSMEYKATFELDWDPLSFIKEQQYVEKADEALKGAITLTGSANDAQALTTSEYLSQTWPATGKFVMQLVVDVVRNTTGRCVDLSARLPDGTEVAVWIEGTKFLVTAVGTGDSLAEVGQQFAWLGAALRTSPAFAKGIITCVPFVKTKEIASSAQATASTGSVEIFCVIGFKINEPAASEERPLGQCWHNMFRNPVMVNGYPIRTKCEHGVGLEMPLNMIAGLAGSERAVEFNGRVFIKGFSTMLIAAKLVGDLLIWHYSFDSKGGRISYLDHTLRDGQDISLPQLDGAAGAQYNIDGTGLPRPHPGAFLEKVTISGGKVITGGAIFAVGVNNIPPHLVRNGYIPKLMWIHTTYVIMWDEADKRGWLVNGTSALLHLVRASLKHYSTSAFSSVLLFEPGKMNDTDEHMPESAVRVLIDPNNRELEIWPGKNEISKEEEIKEKANKCDPEASKSWKKKRGFTLFEDLVEQQYTILELIMEHHKHLAGQNGINLKVRTRKHLEGWDFKELVTGYDPRPRVVTLQALGYGWVDFVRSIGAVTLLGRGFGHIIRPFEFDGMCSQWKRLPTRKYYLAASAFDLNKIVETFGSKGSGPLEPVDGLLWHCPKQLFAPCHCQGRRKLTTYATRHYDPVQVFYPKRSCVIFRPRRPDGLGSRGVAVFGHNVSWPYRWKEGGNKDAEEVDLEEGLPLTTVHALEAPMAPQEMNWKPAYPDADLSVISQSSRSHESTDGTISRFLRSANTALTTPDESVGRPTRDFVVEEREYMGDEVWRDRWVERDCVMATASTQLDVPGQREMEDKQIEMEYYAVPDRQILNVERVAPGQRIVPVSLDGNSHKALRREKRHISRQDKGWRELT